MIKSADIRQQFIDYFKNQHGHKFIPSSPVVPLTDPTLLFTNAGMNQFKPYFLGESKAEFPRAVNSQKCIRVSGKHNDLEEVGRDTYHHTFFEMLGNWSFGDYYKAEAIEWAWKLFTEVWGLDASRLYASVYKDDDEALQLWKKISGLPESRILRFGEKDNFWEMGETGPCGPCSEIHYYRGNDKNQDPGRVNADDADYIELWNLVFIQYNRDENGKLHNLPTKHVDTGAGFERIVATLNNVNSNYETDVFFPLLDKISALSGRDYDSGVAGMPHRVIADHLRMLSFAIADGAIPGNEGRSYVLRRILRRAVRYGRQLELTQPFLHDIVPVLAEQMKGVFPELKQHEQHISNIIKSEEESFSQTLDRGLDIFDKIAGAVHDKKKTIIPGADVFKLYDTFGFPMDLTRLLAEEKGLQIEEKQFEKFMQEQKDRARAAGKFKGVSQEELEWKIIDKNTENNFCGYDKLEAEAQIVKVAVTGEYIYLVFNTTPFYAESGGQVGDKGEMIFPDGHAIQIIDTKLIAENRVHIVLKKELKTDDFKERFQLKVKTEDRRNIAGNHSATHLLHRVLKDVLGEQVKQSGSFVNSDYLRFDFNHHTGISELELESIQKKINEKIQNSLPVQIKEMEYKEAVEEGAVALFGEKYSDKVRTVKMGDYSFELCGGTHVSNTSEILYFLIRSESSIASGVRRIEAVTGKKAHEAATGALTLEKNLMSSFQCKKEDLPQRITELKNENATLRKEVEEMEKKILLSDLDRFISSAREINNIKLIAQKVNTTSMDQLKELGDKLREKCTGTVITLAMISKNQPQVLVAVSDDLMKSGYHAGKLVGKIGKALGGGGGGRPHMATAGGKNVEKLDEVLKNIESFLV